MWLIAYIKSMKPERFMVGDRKPWDTPDLKQHQIGNNPEGFKPKIQNVPW